MATTYQVPADNADVLTLDARDLMVDLLDQYGSPVNRRRRIPKVSVLRDGSIWHVRGGEVRFTRVRGSFSGYAIFDRVTGRCLRVQKFCPPLESINGWVRLTPDQSDGEWFFADPRSSAIADESQFTRQGWFVAPECATTEYSEAREE